MTNVDEFHLALGHRRRIGAALRPLREGVGIDYIMRRIEEAIQRYHEDSLDEGPFATEVRGNEIWLLKRSYGTRKRPPKKALRSLLTTLEKLYREATPRRVWRQVPAYGKGSDKRHPFLVECLRAAGVRCVTTPPKRTRRKPNEMRPSQESRIYPTRLIREVARAAKNDLQK